MGTRSNSRTQVFDTLQSLESIHARASLCKSFAKALLNDPTTTDCLSLSDEDALHACCNTYGAQAARVTARIDRVIDTLVHKRATLLLRMVSEIKAHHVMKRDRQRHLAFMYRRRKSGLRSKGHAKKERYESWAKMCDGRMEAEETVLEVLEDLRGRLRGEFSRIAML